MIGLNVDVFQKVDGIPISPFVGNIVKDLGSRLKVKWNNPDGDDIIAVVNRGACSSEPWNKRRKRKKNEE